MFIEIMRLFSLIFNAGGFCSNCSLENLYHTKIYYFSNVKMHIFLAGFLSIKSQVQIFYFDLTVVLKQPIQLHTIQRAIFGLMCHVQTTIKSQLNQNNSMGKNYALRQTHNKHVPSRQHRFDSISLSFFFSLLNPFNFFNEPRTENKNVHIHLATVCVRRRQPTPSTCFKSHIFAFTQFGSRLVPTRFHSKKRNTHCAHVYIIFLSQSETKTTSTYNK